MTREQIDAIERLLTKATPAPWELECPIDDENPWIVEAASWLERGWISESTSARSAIKFRGTYDPHPPPARPMPDRRRVLVYGGGR